MKQNYCLIKKNKIYAEIYDELLDEELSMNKLEDTNKIKYFIEKKINKSNFIELSEIFNEKDNIISDLILKITSEVNNENLQGNTIIMYADNNIMYEIFHMEDLTKSNSKSDDDLNEFGCISNIHLLPIYWNCGIFKSSYENGKITGTIIDKKDINKIFIENYYHTGILIDTNKEITEIEFTGENPYNTIGNNFIQSNITDIVGFNLIPYIESSDKINEIGTKILGREIKGRIFLALLCPNTNKKYWSINKETINNILLILDDNEKINEIYKYIELDDKYTNPFYILKKILFKV